MFVNEEDIPETVKHWHAFSEELEKEAKAVAPKGVDPPAPTQLTCVVMDNKYLSPAEVGIRNQGSGRPCSSDSIKSCHPAPC